jgi:hypothetical protein
MSSMPRATVVTGSLIEVCVARGGPLRGGRVGAFIAAWAIVSHSKGHAITLDEYRDWWCEPERTAYRHQANFRALFPHLHTPQPLADALIRAYRDELVRDGVKGVLGKPAPPVALPAA